MLTRNEITAILTWNEITTMLTWNEIIEIIPVRKVYGFRTLSVRK